MLEKLKQTPLSERGINLKSMLETTHFIKLKEISSNRITSKREFGRYLRGIAEKVNEYKF